MNPIRLGLTGLIFAFLDAKSRQEETWLKQQYPNYIDYQKRLSLNPEDSFTNQVL
jgi:protein-S-isoprenylcysteine O-methyltransferase Ste14